MTDRRIATALFVIAFAPYVYFYGGWGANQEVNYALTRAIVEARTFRIDDFTVRDGDIAHGAGGHIYSNKAPGLSVIAAVPYSIQYFVQERGLVHLRDYWRTNKQLVTIAVCGVAGALIAPVLFLYGRRVTGVSRWSAAVPALAVAFGTIVFPYSTMLFAHVPGALFLLLSFVLVGKRPLAAGAAAGASGAAFFMSVLAAPVLLGLAWRYSRKHALWFVAGGVPFAVALALYQWICFGSPLTTPVERSVAFTEEGLLLGVFGSPHLERLRGVLFSEYRGLFVSSPVLLFSIAGAVRMVRERRLPAELSAIGAIAVVLIGANVSFNGWHGGAAFGPRYLIPLIPLLAIPMMFAAERMRLLWLIAGALSVAINLAATAVDPMPLDGLKRPLTGYIAPTLVRHRVTPETRAYLYPDCATLRCTPGKVSVAQDAGNFGEPLLGRGRASTVLPAAIWIAAAAWWILASARRLDRRDAAMPDA